MTSRFLLFSDMKPSLKSFYFLFLVIPVSKDSKYNGNFSVCKKEETTYRLKYID